MEKLPGNYIAGFVDGEGCFALKFSKETKRNRTGNPVYYRWAAEFVICLKKDDIDILTLIEQTLGTGTVHATKNYVRYSVQKIEDLYKKIIPFFNSYRLRAKKAIDFELWKKAVNIIHKNTIGNTATKGIKGFSKKQWDKKDLIKLIAIRKEMLKIKASRNNNFRYGTDSLVNFSYR